MQSSSLRDCIVATTKKKTEQTTMTMEKLYPEISKHKEKPIQF